MRGFAPVPLVFAKPVGFTIYLQCLQGSGFGPPFFPAGKESAAGGVKKGGQGGLPMGPLDDPPTANKGGVRAPLFGLIPRGAHCKCARERRRRDLHWAAALPCDCAEGASWICFVLRRGKALRCCPFLAGSWFFRWDSFGEYVDVALVFELWGLFALLLWQRVTSLECCSGEQGRRSSLQERTFVCN